MKVCWPVLIFIGLVSVFAFFSPAQSSQGGDADLAQDLANPIADLITLPIQMSYDSDIGPDDEGFKVQTNIQPVIPFGLNDHWNLITRTIVPVVYQEDIVPGAGSQFGLGDTSLTMFFSPKEKGTGGFMWGVGPLLMLPTATEKEIGGEKWGAGPSGIVLKEIGSWTVGALVNHVWSFAGKSERSDINNSFLQPFVAHTWPSAWTVSLQSETNYNWETESWSVPVNLAVSKLVWMGRLPVSLQAGVGYWLESPDSGPEGFRFRLQANFVLPK